MTDARVPDSVLEEFENKYIEGDTAMFRAYALRCPSKYWDELWPNLVMSKLLFSCADEAPSAGVVERNLSRVLATISSEQESLPREETLAGGESRVVALNDLMSKGYTELVLKSGANARLKVSPERKEKKSPEDSEEGGQLVIAAE
jgi:hypothetical protein